MSKTVLLVTFFTLLLASCQRQAAVSTPTDQPNNAQRLATPTGGLVSAHQVDYLTSVTGYYAKPSEGGEHPGVIMIHEWWGLNDHIQAKARELASEGYHVLAVDLFNGSVAQTAEEARSQTAALDQQQALDNMNAAIAYLVQQGATKVGVLGWCFGGNQALQVSLANPELAATVIYYGNVITDPTQLASINWPVLGIFGEQDQSIPVANIRAFEAGLQQNNIPHTIKIYPGVGHAFANPSNEHFAPEETEDAWWHTREFLEEHLKEI